MIDTLVLKDVESCVESSAEIFPILSKPISKPTLDPIDKPKDVLSVLVMPLVIVMDLVALEPGSILLNSVSRFQ
ncbi:hypothetical protein NT01CX_2364 [Clostridium novyi NT]|uniref:Uncharacterized protein n=1 Tax=Clostridium novyi (strain NT) TaxID=386415 RepID=A0Q1D5_CLONN|nr:hypothetical protein NT01CX_2364 [Clostridium novyi NT]